MTVVTYMAGATGLTIVRQMATPGELTGLNLPRTIVAGTLATAGLLFVGQSNSEVAGKLAALIFITSALVHGGRLAELVNNYIGETDK